jgi:hypothetical protein
VLPAGAPPSAAHLARARSSSLPVFQPPTHRRRRRYPFGRHYPSQLQRVGGWWGVSGQAAQRGAMLPWLYMALTVGATPIWLVPRTSLNHLCTRVRTNSAYAQKHTPHAAWHRRPALLGVPGNQIAIPACLQRPCLRWAWVQRGSVWGHEGVL